MLCKLLVLAAASNYLKCSFPAKKVLVAGGIVLVIVAAALAITLPLTVFKSKSFKGSDVLNEVPLVASHNDLPCKKIFTKI